MLNFQQIILKKFFSLFLVLFIIVGSIVYYWMKAFYIEQTKSSLVNSVELISLELAHSPYKLDDFARKVHDKLGIRVTLIDVDGNVLAESDKDKSTMDNHKYRDEIVASNRESYGYKIRYSKTIEQYFLYVAKRYEVQGEILYIRLAVQLKSINEQIFSLGLKVFGVLVLFFILVLFITYKINKQIQVEMQKIVRFLKELTKKKKPTYLTSNFSQEFYTITSLLSKVSQILIKKEKQKSKYTAKLEISNQQKDDIISAISHEFKNPIAVINGYSQTLLDDVNINPNIRNKFLEKIFKNGVKLSELIDTLRLSIKLDSGQQSLNFTTINLYELVQDSVESVKINHPHREAIIQGEQNITIEADGALFGVVISNLIENAFKYSEDEVIITFDKNGLSVTDSGIGINAKDLENITNKFYRVHTNSWNNSLGLGLFIVNNIIRLHKFKLSIKSEENEGSTFSISF
ncbi:MAG: sensor histidine kinase [Campylobacterales bacterium]|nr:sensor histidine kinase [Campylobacterales bacterium]